MWTFIVLVQTKSQFL